MDKRADGKCMMSNEEYREELRKMFESVDENYKLKWFYEFVKEKTRGSY